MAPGAHIKPGTPRASFVAKEIEKWGNMSRRENVAKTHTSGVYIRTTEFGWRLDTGIVTRKERDLPAYVQAMLEVGWGRGAEG